jgi:outer membrane immunogenic protein
VFALGGVVGVNMQINRFVFGVETDMSSASIEILDSAGDDPYSARWSSDWVGHLRGRAEMAFDRIFIFGTLSIALSEYSLSVAAVESAFALEQSDTLTGITYGVGGEYAINDNLSLKAEYFVDDFEYFNQPITIDTPDGLSYIGSLDFSPRSHNVRFVPSYGF